MALQAPFSPRYLLGRKEAPASALPCARSPPSLPAALSSASQSFLSMQRLLLAESHTCGLTLVILTRQTSTGDPTMHRAPRCYVLAPCECWHCVNARSCCNPLRSPNKEGTIIMPILQMRKLRPRTEKQLNPRSCNQ